MTETPVAGMTELRHPHDSRRAADCLFDCDVTGQGRRSTQRPGNARRHFHIRTLSLSPAPPRLCPMPLPLPRSPGLCQRNSPREHSCTAEETSLPRMVGVAFLATPKPNQTTFPLYVCLLPGGNQSPAGRGRATKVPSHCHAFLSLFVGEF